MCHSRQRHICSPAILTAAGENSRVILRSIPCALFPPKRLLSFPRRGASRGPADEAAAPRLQPGDEGVGFSAAGREDGENTAGCVCLGDSRRICEILTPYSSKKRREEEEEEDKEEEDIHPSLTLTRGGERKEVEQEEEEEEEEEEEKEEGEGEGEEEEGEGREEVEQEEEEEKEEEE